MNDQVHYPMTHDSFGGPQAMSSNEQPSQPMSQPSSAPAASISSAPGTQLMSEQDVCRWANELFERSPDWVTFFREVLGLNGIIRQTYNTPDSLAKFEHSPEYAQIQQMLARLREQGGAAKSNTTFEPTRVITVRLPKSLHESLRAEAHERRTSMNKLCISKLLQVIDDELIPAEA